MTTVFDIDPAKLINNTADELKKDTNFKPPEWADFVKTGAHKERPPADPEWWFKRTASVLRTVYVHGPVGVQRLRTKYGGSKNRGSKPSKSYKGSGNIIRKALQQLEKSGYVRRILTSKKKGREVTAKGQAFLDKIASNALRK